MLKTLNRPETTSNFPNRKQVAKADKALGIFRELEARIGDYLGVGATDIGNPHLRQVSVFDSSAGTYSSQDHWVVGRFYRSQKC